MMEPNPYPSDDAIVRTWTVLHAELRPELTAADIVYLQRVLFDLDDDLLARLLAAKLAHASRPAPGGTALVTARAGIRVRFTLDGRENHATLVHGRDAGPGGLGIASRYGTALFGLRAGDTILWPNHQRRLVELRVLELARCERSIRHGAAAAFLPRGQTCVSG